MGNPFLKAQGHSVGDSLGEDDGPRARAQGQGAT